MNSSTLLGYEWVKGERAAPDATVVMLHGILGQKRNLFGFARRFVNAIPQFNVLLVDLRNHGDSQGFAPPHSLRACAGDLKLLFEYIKVEPKAVIGHSFGAGVALTYARQNRCVSNLWLLDAVPALSRETPRKIDTQTDQILDALAACILPKTRADFMACLKSRGINDVLCGWLAMNLTERAGNLTFRPDPVLAREMIDDFLCNYIVDDLDLGNDMMRLFVVQAERNSQWQGPIANRINELEREGKLKVLCLPRSGHWVHIDNPEALLELMRPEFA